MNSAAQEAFKQLELRILELTSRLKNLEHENHVLRRQIDDKDKSLDALRNQIKIATEELDTQLKRIKIFRDDLQKSQE
ncbi:hypothetical protein [Parasutterella muris]|uniref:hypothetical protein n=1 Tax=Parasutterella muris TaxID=2565572 RepID=UPI00204175EC|nr:hypothetical protein [Parasutterella muris]